MARQISVHSAGDDQLLAPGRLHGVHDALSSQVLMKVRLIGFCSGNTSCSPLMRKPPRSSSTVVRIVGTSNTLAALASPIDVVDDHRRLVAVQVGELERLVVDQHQDAVLGRQQRVESGLRGLAHGISSSAWNA